MASHTFIFRVGRRTSGGGGDLWKKIILLEVKGRIDWESVKGISEYKDLNGSKIK